MKLDIELAFIQLEGKIERFGQAWPLMQHRRLEASTTSSTGSTHQRAAPHALARRGRAGDHGAGGRGKSIDNPHLYVVPTAEAPWGDHEEGQVNSEGDRCDSLSSLEPRKEKRMDPAGTQQLCA